MNCPYCGSEVDLVDSFEIYHNNKYKGWMYACSNRPQCDAYVGCHPRTKTPLGRLANKKLRLLKNEAHRQFDPLWKSGHMTRRNAYYWLAHKLNIPVEKCHIGMFDVEDCQRTIRLCSKIDEEKVVAYKEATIGKYSYSKNTMFSRGYMKHN